MKSRLMGENILKLLTIYEYCENTNTPVVGISVDFRKAFDTVKWEAIDQALKTFNFGEFFCGLIKTINNEIIVTVTNNGKWDRWFSINRGCRQGSPSSALIFILVAETLGIRLRANKKIKGVKIYRETITSCQYADDMWIILSPEAENINEFLREMEVYEEYSGLAMNIEKSTFFKLGKCRREDFQFITKKTVTWSTEPVKILGIWFTHDSVVRNKLNFFDTLEKCKNILNSWRKRKLTTMGKISVVNSLVSSLFAHKLMTLPTPPVEFYSQYKSIILDFIWDGKPHKVAYSKLIQGYDHGGLKLVDLRNKEIALKCKWPLYFEDKKEDWFYGIANVDCRIWQYNTSKQDVLNYIKKKGINTENMFVQIWLAWTQVFFEIPIDTEEILRQFIFANSCVRRANVPMWDKVYQNSLFDHIYQLKHETEMRFLKYEEFKVIYGPILTIMEYNSLIVSIPPVWKMEIKEFTTLPEYSKYEMWEKKKRNITKTLYWQLTEVKRESNVSRILWEKDLGNQLDQDEWNKNMLKILKITNVTKLRNFQYNIVNRTLTTNNVRAKFTDISPNCTFCEVEIETINHIMYQCKEVQKLWKALSRWILRLANIKVEMTNPMIICNNYSGKSNKFINTLIILMKRFIYVRKCCNEKLEFIPFIQYVDKYCRIERTIVADDLRKVAIHNRKWSPYINF